MTEQRSTLFTKQKEFFSFTEDKNTIVSGTSLFLNKVSWL